MCDKKKSDYMAGVIMSISRKLLGHLNLIIPDRVLDKPGQILWSLVTKVAKKSSIKLVYFVLLLELSAQYFEIFVSVCLLRINAIMCFDLK